MTATGTRAAVNMGKGKLNTDLKRTKWVWRPKGTYLDHVSKDNGSFMLKKVEYVYPKKRSCYKDQQWLIVLLYHMTGNKLIFHTMKDYNGGFVAFGSYPKGGSSGKDKGPTQEYILLSLQPHRTRILVKDVVQDAQEQPSENEGQHQMPEDDQVWQDELEMMVTQEVLANAMNDESRQAFEEEKRRIASQKKAAQATSTNQLSTDRTFVSTGRPFVSTDRSNTPNVSAASTSKGANADASSFVYLGGKIPIDA
ncbi:hypothetical protein Tco_0543068 [Tanacetum coccineum]